jgi:ABC-type transporter Mla subunit MlaD
MREAATHWFEARNALKRNEDEVEESARTFRAFVTWINGDEFEETIGHIASARNAVEDTRRQLNSMRSYINTQLDKTTKFQESVDQSLIHIKTLVTKLRDLLKGGSSDPF